MGIWLFVLELVLLMPEPGLAWQMEKKSGYRFEIMLESSVYYVNAMPPGPPIIPTMEVTLLLSNQRAEPLVLTFDTAQRFDLVLLDNEGLEVWRLSEGREYLRERQTVTITGQWVAKEKVKLADRKGDPLPDGYYQLKAVLTAQPRLSAEITFEVKTVH